VPPTGGPCPTCGEVRPPVRAAEYPRLPTPLRKRMKLLRAIRVAIVVAVVVGVAWDIGSSVLAGPTTFADPLTTKGTLTVDAGTYTYFSGAITGEDYIDGNYTVVQPLGVPIDFAVYNSTGFQDFVDGQPASPIWSTTNATSSRIIFAAPYTDTFSLVFENPYPLNSGINVTVYETTSYQTNVVIG